MNVAMFFWSPDDSLGILVGAFLVCFIAMGIYFEISDWLKRRKEKHGSR